MPMARPRFLDRIDPDLRARVEPELQRRIRAGEEVDPLHAWLAQGGVVVSRATVANYRREVLGASSEDEDQRVRRLAAASAQPGAEATPANSPAAPDELEVIDHRLLLQQQLRTAQHIAKSADRLETRLSAAKLVGDLSAQLRELDKEQQQEKGPRVVAYVPVRRTLEELEIVSAHQAER